MFQILIIYYILMLSLKPIQSPYHIDQQQNSIHGKPLFYSRNNSSRLLEAVSIGNRRGQVEDQYLVKTAVRTNEVRRVETGDAGCHPEVVDPAVTGV